MRATAAALVISLTLALAGVVPVVREAPAAIAATLPSEPLDALDATDLSGARLAPAHLRGRIVLIDFWATWCAPCLAELPRLKALRNAYSREEFEIVGVMLEPSSRRTLVSWLNRHRIDWPQLHERLGYEGPVARAFDVRQLPATVLVDRHGSIASINLRGDALTARVKALVEARRAGGWGDRR